MQPAGPHRKIARVRKAFDVDAPHRAAARELPV
jgi:hypothetical protein